MKYENKFVTSLINELSACMYIEHGIDLNPILETPEDMVTAYTTPWDFGYTDTYVNYPIDKARLTILHKIATSYQYEVAVLPDYAEKLREPAPSQNLYDIKVPFRVAFLAANFQCINEDMDLMIINDAIFKRGPSSARTIRRWCGLSTHKQLEKKIENAILDDPYKRYYTITMNSVQKETVI